MNLALDFGLPSSEGDSVAIQPLPPAQVLAERFREAMLQDDSPVRAVRHQPAQTARFGPFPEQLNPALRTALALRGIENLYSHQAAAVELSLARKNVVVVTPTASGKTLCYNLPVLQSVLSDSAARAIYLFPTKALAEDHRFH